MAGSLSVHHSVVFQFIISNVLGHGHLSQCSNNLIFLGVSVQTIMQVETSSLDGLTFDGRDLWISDVEDKSLKRVSLAEQSVLKRIEFAPGGTPKAICFANDSLLVLNYDKQNQITTEMIQINMMNGHILRSLPCPDFVDSGLVFDNTNFWGSSYREKCLCQFSAGTGELLHRIDFDSPVSALSWDGDNLVVGLDKFETDKCSVIGMLDIQTGVLSKTVEIDAHFGGIAFAEQMVFYTNREEKEIQVTRIRR
jgi:hypothetical protein